jgi:hypothetical protein
MNKVLVLAALFAVGAFWYFNQDHSAQLSSVPEAGVIDESDARTRSNVSQADVAGDGTVDRAFEDRESNVQVSGRGTVTKILPDDNKGSRHQRFILLLASGRTLLISHNIDLAPRIDSLEAGDEVEVFGEYEWNEKGGLVHWTHHDPQGRHLAGWLKHEGRVYQ